MAETKDDIELVDENTGKPKKRILIIAAIIVLTGIAATLSFLSSNREAETAQQVEPVEQASIYQTVKNCLSSTLPYKAIV